MIVSRRATWMVTAILASSFLAACSGSDDEPSIKPTSAPASTPSAAADPDGFSPEQRQVADAVQAYNQATFGTPSDQVANAISSLVTPEVLSGVTKALGDGTSYTAVPSVTPERVTVEGDTATFTGCRDGANVYSLKKGQTEAGEGSVAVGYSRLTFTLDRQDDRWIISDPRGEQVSAC